MKKRFLHYAFVCTIVGSGLLGEFAMPVAAQVEVPTPRVGTLDPVRGPQDDILQLEIREGLKQFLLARLYARYAKYDEALDILERQLEIEADPDIRELLNYLRRTITPITDMVPASESGDDLPSRASEEDEILNLQIEQEGLKQYLLADLYVTFGEYDKAVEIVEQQLGKEDDPEMIRLWEYQRQTIRGIPTPPPEDPIRKKKQQADFAYTKANFRIEMKTFEKALPHLRKALPLYQDIGDIEGQKKVHHLFALAYRELKNTDEACWHAQQFMKLVQAQDTDEQIPDIQKLLEELKCAE